MNEIEKLGFVRHLSVAASGLIQGKNIELRTSENGEIQWRVEGEGEWKTLFLLSEISPDLLQTTGDRTDAAMSQKAVTDAINHIGGGIELRAANGYIQWRAVGAEEWINMIPLSDLSIELLQSTGSRTDAAMSQKAVTDAINSTSGEVPGWLPDYQTYVFKRSAEKPAAPTITTTDDLDNEVGGYWKDYPNTPDSDWWQCIGIVDGTKKKGDDGFIKSWSGVFPLNGKDGSSTEFRWKDVSVGATPEFTDEQRKQRDPEGWVKNPGALADGFSRWQTHAAIKPDNTENGALDGLWAIPYKVSGEDGKAGISGASLKIKYQRTNSATVPPVVVVDNLNPGSLWDSLSNVGDGKYLWVITATILPNGALSGVWQGPELMTGIQGAAPDYKSYVYKKTDSKPAAPTVTTTDNLDDAAGGYWKDYPDTPGNWWQCVGTVDGSKERGETGFIKSWSDTYPFNGRDGVAQDGKYTELRWLDVVKGGTPILSDVERQARVPEGWSKIPSELSPENYRWQIEAVILPNDTIEGGYWSKPYRISGEDGTDGTDGQDGRDGKDIEFIFTRTATLSAQPEQPNSVNSDDYIPEGWTDDPTGISESLPYEWVSKRTRVDGAWGVFSRPALWAKYGFDGQDGRAPNSTVQIFKRTASKPSSPTDTAHIPPQGSGANVGWVRIPDNAGTWWQCVGAVDGSKTEGDVGYVLWGEVLPLSGEDGRSTEIRFKALNIGIIPTLTTAEKKDRNILGWSVDPPEVSDQQYLWMIVGVINPDNTMYGDGWTSPRRLTGPIGPTGGDGPAGKDGVDGVHGIDGLPGITIEMRYSIGSASGSVAASPEGAKTRQPTGWTTTLPSAQVTEENPYIWFTQAHIIYANNQEVVNNPYTEGEVAGEGWEKPARLSGINGTNGAPGTKGQVVFPAGIYSPDREYICTNEKAPYVYDNGSFYVLNYITEEPWVGNQQQYQTPHEVVAAGLRWWIKFESYEAIFAKIGIIANGLFGSAVFNGEYMFSQQGIDANGNRSFNYEKFNASNPNQLFRVFWPTSGNVEPSKPTSMDPTSFRLNTGGAISVEWQRCPVINKYTVMYWYECDGIIDGTTNTIKEWGEPFLYYNTNSDTAIIYAKNDNSLVVPDLDREYINGDPPGWNWDYDKILPISSSEKLWFTTGYFESPNVLYQQPICANEPVKHKPDFTPNVMINYATGAGHYAARKIVFGADGDVRMQEVEVGGKINAKELGLGLWNPHRVGPNGELYMTSLLTDCAIVTEFSPSGIYILPALALGTCREIRFCVPMMTRTAIPATIETENMDLVRIAINGSILGSVSSYNVANIAGWRGLFIGYCRVDESGVATTYWLMYDYDNNI